MLSRASERYYVLKIDLRVDKLRMFVFISLTGGNADFRHCAIGCWQVIGAVRNLRMCVCDRMMG